MDYIIVTCVVLAFVATILLGIYIIDRCCTLSENSKERKRNIEMKYQEQLRRTKEQGTYTAWARCVNCNHGNFNYAHGCFMFKIQLPKGQRISGLKTKCPNCEVAWLSPR